MAWLRIDDGFITNRKIAQLTDGELRVWMRVLCFSAEHRRQRGGRLTAADRREIAGFTPARLKRFQSLGLIDATGVEGVVEVHDFDVYNPTDKTAAERKKRQRDREAAGNVTRDEHRDNARDGGRDPSHTRESPYPYPSDSPEAAGSTGDTAALPADLNDQLQAAGWDDAKLELARHKPDRARIAIDRANAEATSNPGGYAWTLFASDDDLERAPAPRRVVNGTAHATPTKLLYLNGCTAIYAKTGDPDRVRSWLKDHVDDEATIEAHVAAVVSRARDPLPEAV